ALLALFGLSLTISDDVKHQNVVNLAALAGISAFMNNPDLTYSDRATASLNSVNNIVADPDRNNSLKSQKDISQPLPKISFNNSTATGGITLGKLYEDCSSSG